METYKEVEARMPVDKDGSYKRRPGDWENREGCVRPMISLREQEPFTVTHKVSLRRHKTDKTQTHTIDKPKSKSQVQSQPSPK